MEFLGAGGARGELGVIPSAGTSRLRAGAAEPRDCPALAAGGGAWTRIRRNCVPWGCAAPFSSWGTGAAQPQYLELLVQDELGGSVQDFIGAQPCQAVPISPLHVPDGSSEI